MAQTSGFFNSHLDSQGNFDRVYLAEQFASYFSNFIGNGVFAHLLDKFVVTAETGLSVNVGTGKAFVKGFWFESDAQETLSIDLPDGLLNRKDNIVIRFDFENRTTGIYVVKGVAATTPSAPEVVRNSLVFELKIAEIFVGASISAISQSAITDTRSNNNVCGWVTGLVDQVDTTTLFEQWTSAYNNVINEMNAVKAEIERIRNVVDIAPLTRQYVENKQTIDTDLGRAKWQNLNQTGSSSITIEPFKSISTTSKVWVWFKLKGINNFKNVSFDYGVATSKTFEGVTVSYDGALIFTVDASASETFDKWSLRWVENELMYSLMIRDNELHGYEFNFDDVLIVYINGLRLMPNKYAVRYNVFTSKIKECWIYLFDVNENVKYDEVEIEVWRPSES